MKHINFTAILGAMVLMGFSSFILADDVAFESSWCQSPKRTWVGPEYWANRLQDWTVQNGRLECANLRLPGRTVHLLTRRISNRQESLFTSVQLGALDKKGMDVTSASGFLIGAGSGDLDYRSAALIQSEPGPDGGYFAGITASGRLVIRDNSELAEETDNVLPANIVLRKQWEIIHFDSEEADAPAKNAIDGKADTFWHTQWRQKKSLYPHEIQIDMGQIQSINGLLYLPRQQLVNGRIKQYEFYASLDSKKWNKPLLKSNFTDNEKLHHVQFKTTKARYIRLVAISEHRNRPAMTIAELAVIDATANPEKIAMHRTANKKIDTSNVILKLNAKPLGEKYQLTLSAYDPSSKQLLGEITKEGVSAKSLAGNIALCCGHSGKKGLFWFKNWQVSGPKVDAFKHREVGPIISSQYTVSRNILKLTAQMMPIGQTDNHKVQLQVKKGTQWKTIAESTVSEPSYTAIFRVTKWNTTSDTPYRLLCNLNSGEAQSQSESWGGVVRKNPLAKPTFTVAAFTGNHNNKWGFGKTGYPWNAQTLWFPHQGMYKQVAKHQPDLLFFSGDQIYENVSPTFADRKNINLDYLYKWYLWCWATRHLTKDIPCITIPDDHDVFQGNLWGQGGRHAVRQGDGGFVHPAHFIEMLQRTQISNLPDPYDPTPVEQNIGVYYTDLNWGGISFAILEDRKFKTGQESTEAKSNDPDQLVLLGKRQLDFLRHWSADWSDGVQMKATLSQTVFCCQHTGWGVRKRSEDPGQPSIDYDSNGWPKNRRDQALQEIRKGFALMVGGDQHLATIIQHGVDQFDDSGWSFCVPSIANYYPRYWKPSKKYRMGICQPDMPGYTGQYLDGFGNRMTVWAVANPRKTGHAPTALHDNSPGYGIVKFNKDQRTIKMACWPRYADATDVSQQYPGWPKTIKMEDNYGRKAVAYLPAITVAGMTNPVVQVINESNNQIIYTLRIKGNIYRAKVFEKGTYTVKIGEPGTDKMKTLTGITALPLDKQKTIEVKF